jgi:hypothetical protein
MSEEGVPGVKRDGSIDVSMWYPNWFTLTL